MLKAQNNNVYKITGIYIIMSIFLINCSVAQPVLRTGLDLTMDGYLFTIRNYIFFQPVDYDSNQDFLESFDNRNFMLTPQSDNLYEECLKGIGQKLLVKGVADSNIKSNPDRYVDSLFFFKATIKLNMQILDTSDFKVFSDSKFNFFINNNSYKVYWFFIQSKILDIIPEKKYYIRTMYNFYKLKEFSVPKWLENRYKLNFGFKNRK